MAIGEDRIGVSRLGENESTRVAAVTAGLPATLWLPAGVLRGALETMVGSAVSLTYSAPDRPVRLTPVEQSRLGALLMPSLPQP